MGHLDGKSVVVTGGGGAIGEAYSKLAAAEGATVVVCDIKEGDAKKVADEISASGGRALVRAVDVTDWQQAEELIEYCVAETGRIDGIINNAAIFHMVWAGEEDEQKLRRILNVNILGVVACGNFAIRQMRKQGSGSVINIVSGAFMGMRYAAAYSATKGAIASLTHTWTLENDDVPGVRVNAISPSGRREDGRSMANGYEEYLASSMRGVTPSPGYRFPLPEDNAPVAVFLLSDAAEDIKGQIVHISGTTLALISHPTLLDPILTSDQRWTVDGVGEAFRTRLHETLVPTTGPR